MNVTDNATDATKTVLLCGVGGQGTILAADVLAQCFMRSGMDVKVSEIHGMAQRGGAVTTVVRFGERVSSMVCWPGSADYVVSFETTEAMRNAAALKPGATFIVNDETILPQSVLTAKAEMPPHIHQDLEKLGAVFVPASRIAAEAGNVKAANVALLGALSRFLSIDEGIWTSVLRELVPERFIEVNLRAFQAGAGFVDMIL